MPLLLTTESVWRENSSFTIKNGPSGSTSG